MARRSHLWIVLFVATILGAPELASWSHLLPASTNIRRVFVDDTTPPVTFSVGSNHAHRSWNSSRST